MKRSALRCQQAGAREGVACLISSSFSLSRQTLVMVRVGDGGKSQQKQSAQQCMHVSRGEDKEGSIVMSFMVADHSLAPHAGGQRQVLKLWYWVKDRG